MPRKKIGKVEKIAKPTPEQLSEWESVLEKQGLRMGRGNRNWLTYAGASRDLDALNGAIQENTGKVKGR